MTATDGASSISVTVRVRPFTIREAAQLTKCDDTTLFLGDGSLAAAPTPKLSQKGLRSVIKVVDDKCLVFDPPEDNPIQKFSRSVVPMGRRVKDQTFGFDRIFDDNATQAEVYEGTARPLIDNVLDGYNATVFAYGATGCGKTHTITGTIQQPGIIFLTMQELFERISDSTGEKVTEVSLSYLEIYNETIRDLLEPTIMKGGLHLREDCNQAVSVAGLSTHRPQNVQEVMDMIMKGNEMRTMSPTEANATSSRSHAVLQINVAQKDRNASVEEPHTMATLSIIDLAGSERASATKNRGERLLEGANINKSLLALGSCINALCDPRKRNHVPYRNSKLTRLLKFSLGGNCKTVMIVCVSPSSQHFDETQNTLRYANRAKNIQTKVTRNVYNVNRHVKDFLVKIDEQIILINELKAQLKDYEAVALSKLRKQTERREAIAREGIMRIRSAYEHSASERQERISNMIKLKELRRRMEMISAWIAALDGVCTDLPEDQPLKSVQGVRKMAQGILIELEAGRHHCQQKVVRSAWDRGINSALEHSLKQLGEVVTGDALDAETLGREVELLKANAEREALSAVAEYEKAGDAATIQILVKTHFEAIAAIERLNRMSVDEAVEAASGILEKMLNGATNATSFVIKPDGSLAATEAFPPSKSGTPKKRKVDLNSSTLGSSPIRPKPGPIISIQSTASPAKSSPRRRALTGGAKKSVSGSLTPKKRRSPVKSAKRGVRWRDDTEDGALAEFEKTPQKFAASPEESTGEFTLPVISELTTSFTNLSTDSPNSSPLISAPDTTMNVPSKNNRFETGFLSKKSDGSPDTTMAPPKLTLLTSSDTEPSPLRELGASRINRRSLTPTSLKASKEISCSDSNSTVMENTSDIENRVTHSSKADAIEIRNAVRKTSSGRHSSVHLSRTQRRRSPTAATAMAGSPPNDGLFGPGHVRRMVTGKSEKENDWKVSVLSPRVQGVVPIGHRTAVHSSGGGARRMTVSGLGPEGRGQPRENNSSTGMGIGDRAAVRMSSVIPGQLQARTSLVPNGKVVWR